MGNVVLRSPFAPDGTYLLRWPQMLLEEQSETGPKMQKADFSLLILPILLIYVTKFPTHHFTYGTTKSTS